MAKPLPNTNAPASAKYHAIVTSVAVDAAPASPEMDQSGSGNKASVEVPAEERGGASTSRARMPLARNSHATSDSVQAVTTALIANRHHNKTFLASVSFVSL